MVEHHEVGREERGDGKNHALILVEVLLSPWRDGIKASFHLSTMTRYGLRACALVLFRFWIFKIGWRAQILP